MNTAFIIAEYNPFHNGHVYHIAKTKNVIQPDALICVLSGHFTQRGSAAIVDKWSRARMALRAGADLVLELHPVYACSSAEYFARGALLTASSLGIGGWLSFGAECAELTILSDLGHILNAEPEPYKTLLDDSLGSGLSYAAARQRALIGCYLNINAGAFAAREKITGNELETIIKAPNNILAIEYIRAIKHFGLPFAPFAAPRVKSNSNFVYYSASRIRDEIKKYYRVSSADVSSADVSSADVSYEDDSSADDSPAGDSFGFLATLPEYTIALLEAEFSLGRGPVFDDAFFSSIVALLRREGAASLLRYKDVNEGLENRIIEAASTAISYDELIENAAAKRYPKSRIRRILTRFILGFDNTATDGIGADNGPPYLRVLGFTETGRKLLSNSKPCVPIISNFKKINGEGTRAQAFARLEAKATDIYAAAFQNPRMRAAGQDYIRGPVRL